MTRIAVPTLFFILLIAWGCSAPRGPLVVTDPDPSVKIPAIKKSVETHDTKAAAQLVKDLDSDDPAVRFYAIDALRRLTGQTFGYVYYEDEEERADAVKKWQQWLSTRESDTTQPSVP
ncbi:MAG: hypothetical protein ACREJC_17805 [Tepidisphaeraceae bacterium]